jgi:glycogen debranching enzyme
VRPHRGRAEDAAKAVCFLNEADPVIEITFTFRLLSSAIFLMPLGISAQGRDSLTIESVKEVGQIEIGSPYVGVEIHKSFPLLNRISFYYPVANSIDISTDYWKRENFRIMSLGLKVGSSPKRFLKPQVYRVSQTPYSASFTGNDSDSRIRITYEFCRNQPAMVITYEITNTSHTAREYEVYTKLEASLRTSHTYKLVDSAYTSFQKKFSVIRVNYPFAETGNAQVFVMNVGLEPSSFATREADKPVAAFTYKRRLAPRSSLKIIQIVGSSWISEANARTDFLSTHYQREVAEYRRYIRRESLAEDEIVTGNKDLDFTSRWAKAVMATNAHYLNGQIVPMPAQAEYNFYFTHDALLTDLAAVNFDLARVKRDLKYIVSLADTNRTIPHAYYWKDKKYATEYAGTENWNHFWFTLVCARYLRHSGDREFVDRLYPFIEKSIETALKNKGADDLMWSPRPDWWDIGNNSGPRAYMTILAIRALREFNFISSQLNHDGPRLRLYEDLADRMNAKLTDTLWDSDINYLISYFNDGKEDRHVYMGSLLASHFALLDNDKNLRLLTTAKEKLLDPKLGIYTVYPMDLHLLGNYMKFSGDEAGAPYHYANGGIWPHGNAWYALGLISNDLNEDAFDFVKKTMTLKGIMNSPNGQPALYEYRISDKNDPAAYGRIDKPQFLWAGGWYLYTLYNLFGLRENEWNISFNPFLPSGMDSVRLNVTLQGVVAAVDITGRGRTLSRIVFDGREIPSAVVPDDLKRVRRIQLKLGMTTTPYLSSANALVLAPTYDRDSGKLEFDLQSFSDRVIRVQVISPTPNRRVSVNGSYINTGITESKKNDVYRINFEYRSGFVRNHYSLEFNSR